MQPGQRGAERHHTVHGERNELRPPRRQARASLRFQANCNVRYRIIGRNAEDSIRSRSESICHSTNPPSRYPHAPISADPDSAGVSRHYSLRVVNRAPAPATVVVTPSRVLAAAGQDRFESMADGIVVPNPGSRSSSHLATGRGVFAALLCDGLLGVEFPPQARDLFRRQTLDVAVVEFPIRIITPA